VGRPPGFVLARDGDGFLGPRAQGLGIFEQIFWQPKEDGCAPNALVQTCANSLDNLSSRRHDAECCESSTVDDGLTIHEHLVLTISAVNHVDIDPQVTSQLRCHTGGV
jgi:hypothetical protein